MWSGHSCPLPLVLMLVLPQTVAVAFVIAVAFAFASVERALLPAAFDFAVGFSLSFRSGAAAEEPAVPRPQQEFRKSETTWKGTTFSRSAKPPSRTGFSRCGQLSFASLPCNFFHLDPPTIPCQTPQARTLGTETGCPIACPERSRKVSLLLRDMGFHPHRKIL